MCIKDLVFEMETSANRALSAARKQRLVMKYVFNGFFDYPTSEEAKIQQWNDLCTLLDIANDYAFETDKLLGELCKRVDGAWEVVTAGKEGA